MLKSTYKPSPGLSAPLPPGWTEHKAPTGHTYYFNASTGVSTYTRPGAAQDPATSFLQHQSVPAINLSDPNVANVFMAQYGAANNPPSLSHPNHRNDRDRRPPPQPADKPRSKVAIPGCEPWVLVYTKYGRRFAYHPAKNQSYWRIPEKIMPAVLELDKARIRQKAGVEDQEEGKGTKEGSDPSQEIAIGATPRLSEKSGVQEGTQQENEHDYDSSEYEEVEVTDDENDGNDAEGHAAKRQRTEEPGQGDTDDRPLEFTEADIAEQLAAMGADYAADDEAMEDWEEGDEGVQLSDEDAKALFKDLLDDFNINPYSPWEKLIDEGRVFEDARYTVLTTTKARKEAWEEWSRDTIKLLKEQRAKEEKKDPRIPYMAFLQEKATPKLYWPEFRRKYRKEDSMKDSSLSDKDREKWYREHITRLKLPQSTLKADLKALLESVPASQLNKMSNPSHLPNQILVDLRYISLDPKVRDPFIEAYIQTLRPPPEEGDQVGEEDETAKKAREDRHRRERALRDREQAVAEEKRRQEKKLLFEKANLWDEERELEKAMQVGMKGLQSQLGARHQS